MTRMAHTRFGRVNNVIDNENVFQNNTKSHQENPHTSHVGQFQEGPGVKARQLRKSGLTSWDVVGGPDKPSIG